MAKKMYRIRNQSKNPWTFPVPEEYERVESRKRLVRVDGEEEVVEEEVVKVETRAAAERIVVPPTYKANDPGLSQPFDEDTKEKLEQCPAFRGMVEGPRWIVLERAEDGA